MMVENTPGRSPALLRPDEVAHQLGCGRTTVYELMGSGQLRSVKIGALRRIPATELERYVKNLVVSPR